MAAQPSVAQMAARSHEFHRRALMCVAKGERLDSPSWTASQYRGARTALSTLVRWGCIKDNAVTLRGLELLTALETKFSAVRQ